MISIPLLFLSISKVYGHITADFWRGNGMVEWKVSRRILFSSDTKMCRLDVEASLASANILVDRFL